MKVGIIGTGNLAELHMKAYRKNPDVEIVAVCDFNLERAKQRAEQFGAKEVYQDYKDMLSKSDIDAVSVITWNNTHAEITVNALNAGKHVLCEKPPALNALQALEMEKASQSAGKLLMFGFVRRFEEKAKLLKQKIDDGELGDIYYIKTGYLRRTGNPGGWFANKKISGGGPLIDLGVHMVDLAMFLMNKPKPVSVFGATFNKVGNMANIKGVSAWKAADYRNDGINDVEDMAVGIIKFENGSCIHLETSWTSHIKKDVTYLEVFGSKGGASLEPDLEIYTADRSYLTDIKPVLKSGFDFDACFSEEIDHFVDCVLRGTPCTCSAKDGVTIMKILDAIYASSETGQLIEVK